MRSDPPIPPVWGVYAAAFTVALTTDDAAERHAAARLANEISSEELAPPARPRRRRRPDAFGDLIRCVLDERLSRDGGDAVPADRERLTTETR